MSKKAKSRKSSKKSSKTLNPYKTAKQLGLLPVEREALIAFVKAPSLGNNIALNGHAHHYNQGVSDDADLASNNHCGTAGCVAGYVFHYAKIMAKMKKLRDVDNADDYIETVMLVEVQDDWDSPSWPNRNPHYNPMLKKLYQEGGDKEIVKAKAAVDYMLRNGKVPAGW
jgi:hypothetical protein